MADLAVRQFPLLGAHFLEKHGHIAEIRPAEHVLMLDQVSWKFLS